MHSNTENLSHHRIQFVRGYDGLLSRYWPRSLPGAFISCIDKKRTKEATGGRGAEQISYRNSLLFGTFYPGNNHPLPPDPLTRRSALIVCFFYSIFMSLCDRISNPCPLGHTFTPCECRVHHAVGASRPTTVGCISPTTGGCITRSKGAINCDLQRRK